MKSDPMKEAFRRVLGDRGILLAEIGWRWSFGAIATFLIVIASLSAAATIHIGATDRAAWHSQNPTLMAQALAAIVIESGGSLLRQAAWLMPVLTVLWVALGGFGRAMTLGRFGFGQISFRTIAALQAARAAFMWACAAGLMAAIALSAKIAFRNADPDLLLYYALAIWSVILFGALWGAANWYLSVAAVCSLYSGAGAVQSTKQSIRLARQQGGEVGGISLLFAIYRTVAVAVAFVLCFLPSRLMAIAPRGYTAWAVAVSLAYFAVADFLYIARMAAYFSVISAHGVVERSPESPPSP